jgi:hypothetical protein
MPHPSAQTVPPAPAPLACLLARAGGVRLAIEFTALAEYGPAGALTPVPGAAPWLVGLAQWHGRLLTVVDAGRLFGGSPTRGRLLLVLRELPCETALAVDEVLGSNETPEATDVRLDAVTLRAHPAFRPGAAGHVPAEAS